MNNNPFFSSIYRLIFYATSWIVLIIIQLVVFHYFTSFNLNIIITDALVCNLLQAISILMLWYSVRFYKNDLALIPFLGFHLFLLILSYAIWLGLGYVLTNLILNHDENYLLFFKEILPIRVGFGLLIYIIFVLTYYLFMANSEIEEQKKAVENSVLQNQLLPVEKLERITVKKRKELHVIPVSQIHYIEANGDYVLIYTKEEKYIKDKTMKYWETYLPVVFVRIHRSFIVNIEYISRIELYEKETYKVLMKSGNTLKTSAAGYKLLKQKMG